MRIQYGNMSVIVNIVFNMTSSIFGAMFRVPMVFRGLTTYKNNVEYKDDSFNKHSSEEDLVSEPSCNESSIYGDSPQKNDKLKSQFGKYNNTELDLSTSEIKNGGTLRESMEELIHLFQSTNKEKRKRKKIGKFTIHNNSIIIPEVNRRDQLPVKEGKSPECAYKKSGNISSSVICEIESSFGHLSVLTTNEESKSDVPKESLEIVCEKESYLNETKCCACTKTHRCLACDDVEDGLLTAEELASVDGSDVNWLHQLPRRVVPQAPALSRCCGDVQGDLLTAEELASVEGSDHDWLYQAVHRGVCLNTPPCVMSTKEILEASSFELQVMNNRLALFSEFCL